MNKPQGIILSEKKKSQSQQTAFYMIPLLQDSWNKNTEWRTDQRLPEFRDSQEERVGATLKG